MLNFHVIVILNPIFFSQCQCLRMFAFVAFVIISIPFFVSRRVCIFLVVVILLEIFPSEIEFLFFKLPILLLKIALLVSGIALFLSKIALFISKTVLVGLFLLILVLIGLIDL
ncbi:hypothetical protein PCASD_05897 [Puccinia coronata f. sp. avenae]|uniref:Uncharacterized protein n=1 Tax=Puccinia coronata f. sp. avenae TaxID=200324 RepID=A0A2N5V3Z1_9BASI|nr:hypothetical protein PCASD_05897 [Puccinia coronata f. sp. avenae]